MAEQDQNEALTPTVSIEDVGPARKCLNIEVSPEQIAKRIESSYDQLGSDAVLPGFRKGRAPRRLIERRFGKSIRDDVRAQLIADAFSEAVESEKLEVIGEPDVKDHENIELPEEGPLRFEVEVEVAPEVELPDLDSLKIEQPDSEVTDDQVQEELDRMGQRYGTPETLTEGKPQAGDFLEADVKILAGENADDDAELLQDAPASNVYVPGESMEHRGHVAGIIVDDLGKRLTDAEVGQQIAITTTGPSRHENDQIKDQPITIRLTIKRIERVKSADLEQLPEVMGFESVDELKDNVRRFLEERAERERRSQMHEQVCEQLLEKVDLDLPEGMTGRQTERNLRRRAMEMAYRGMEEHQIEQELAEARESTAEEARRELKLFFILDKVARDLDVEVTQNEVNGRVAMMAMQQGRRPEKLRQQLQRSGQLEHLFLSIREQKALDAIIDRLQSESSPAEQTSDESKSTGEQVSDESTSSQDDSDKDESASADKS